MNDTERNQEMFNLALSQRLREITAAKFRERLLIFGPVVALIVASFWFASLFVQQAPPSRIAIATGGLSGAYYAYGEQYAGILAKSRVGLDVEATAGSAANVALLKNPAAGVQVALLQGGTTNRQESPELRSLGRLYLEPMWIFYRGEATLDRLTEIRGKRIIVGGEGSGTRTLALRLLALNGIDDKAATFITSPAQEGADMLVRGEADVAFFTSGPNATLIQELLRAPGVRLMSLTHAEAYTRNLRYLTRIVLPKGAIDLATNQPPADVEMVAPVAVLAAHQDLHPALVALLVEAAKTVHAPGGLFHEVGEFPKPQDPELEMSADAERAYRAGPNWLNRTLPFWFANWIERMTVLLLPLIGVMIPLVKGVPALYRWQIRRRLIYWYGRLKALEAVLAERSAPQDIELHRAELDVIDEAVRNIPLPIWFADQYYILRSAIDLVRQRLDGVGRGRRSAEARAAE